MAEIKPFKAWRFHPRFTHQIGDLTSPLFDVVDEKQREQLYHNEYNSIHLSVPLGENPAKHALGTLDTWIKNKVIVRDPKPAIYVYYQYFNLPGDRKSYCRKGFITFIKAYDWDEKVILRHENTIPKAVNDREALLHETQLNVSPTHGLFTDPYFELEKYMDEAMKNPIYDEEDYQGVRDVLAIIEEPETIQHFVDKVADQQIILADGHHRYEGSMAYRKAMRENNPNHTGDEWYNYHMMFLTNTEAHDLRILPTHRLVKDLEGFDDIWLLEQIDRYFTIKEIADPSMLNEVILGKKWAFGLLMEDQAYKIRLKPEVFKMMDWSFPNEIKELDLTVLHYFIFEKILGIKRDDQRSSEKLDFERSYSACVSKVLRKKAQIAFITNDISVEEVKKVCRSGFTMPQKSTYFYPKVICGFLFGDVHDNR